MKKNIISIIILIIIIMTSIYHFKNKLDNSDVFDNIGEMNFTELNRYMYDGQELIQKIVPAKDNFFKIKIYFDVEQIYTSLEYTSLYWEVYLKDSNNNIIQKYKYEKVFIEKENSITFQFDSINDSMNKEYYLVIKSFKSGVTLPITMAKNNDQDNYNLWINGELSEMILPYRTYYEKSYDDFEVNEYLFIMFVILPIFLILYLFIRKYYNRLSLHNEYMIIALVISMFMILLTRPYNGNDEVYHWARIYELSNGNLTSDIIDGWPYTMVDEGLFYFEKYNEIGNIINTSSNNELIDMQYTSVYSPISYLPQIIGLNIAKVILPNSFYWSYFIRITQAIFCIICTYFAIKWIPVGKKIVFFIGLLPTYIQATSLISADACLVSSSILFIAKILQVSLSKDKIKRKDYILLFILSATLALSKLVYIPLCLLLLFIPYKRKEGKKEIGIILILTLCITILWNGIALNSLMQGQGINTTYYIRNILQNPLNFLQITLYSFFNQIGNHISDLFGGQNKWYSNTIYDSTIIPLLFFILYIYLTFNEDKDILNKKEKRYLGIILIITYVLISTSLYISCTPIYHDEIIGIQGRYLLPFLLPIYFLIPKGNKKTKINLSIFFIFMYFIYYLNYIIMYV